MTLYARQQERHRCKALPHFSQKRHKLCDRHIYHLLNASTFLPAVVQFLNPLRLFSFLFLLFLILKSLILTCIPKHGPPSHLPPHNISVGHPHAPAPSMLYAASDIDWRIESYMIVYMFQCCSLKLSHPYHLPQSPKVCSLHLCLFCCLTYRVIINIFLNSM